MRLLALSLPLILATTLATSQQSVAAAMTRHVPQAEDAQPISLAPRPGTPLDAAARQLVAHDLMESSRAGDQPLLLIGSASLGAASDRPALFVQLQSARDCGSAGCETTVYLWRQGAWRKVLDGVGGPVSAGPHRTRGMADLVTDKVRYAWNGSVYKDTRPPPAAIDLRRRG
jgi:hypothetical protein